MQHKEGMLTAKEATKLFRDAGLSETTFRKRVNDGIIEGLLPEGRQRGALYPQAQVLAAIKGSRKANTEVAVKRSHPDLKATNFLQATPQDMPQMAALLETFYKAKISVKKRAAWIERNPDIAYILKRKDNNNVVGCAFIMPLSEEKIYQILCSQVKPPTRPNEIELYEPGKRVHLYIRACGVLQAGVGKEQRRYWAARFIRGLAKEIVKLGSEGVYIEKIYAQGDTITGEKLLKMIGFMQIDVAAPTDRKNFMMDIKPSGSTFAMRYKHALNLWRAQNEEE